jgi:putative ABC transport system permease protein
MVQDVGYAWRIFRKSPGFTATVILTLGLGIGANTAVFSVVDGVLLRPLPYKDPARLVDILDASVKDPNLARIFATYSDFEEYARHARSFEKLAFATWAGAGAILTGRGPARNVLAIPVSEDFFSMLGVSAAHGRIFERGDLARGCSVVVSDAFWRNTLAADPAVTGTSLGLNHRACAVVGVMPAGFEFYPRQTQLWMLFTADDPRPRDSFQVLGFARLKPGITAAQAQAELAALHKNIRQTDWQRDFTPAVNRLQDEFTFLAGRNIRATLGLLVVAVALVLLVACLNVAHLLLARWSVRGREFAVRAALGSGRARIVRQLLIEGLLLAAAGGVAGVLIAFAMVKYFLHANPIELPVGSDVAVNVPVLFFTCLLTMAAALVSAMAPAWSGSRADPAAGLRAGGWGAISGANRRLTRALIATEIALSLMLLSGAGLLMRSVMKMSAAPLGFDPDGVMVMNLGLPAQRYAGKAARLRFYENLRARLNAIPGAEGSALAATMPPYGAGNQEVQIAGGARTGVLDVGQNMVGEDYFRVLRIALRRGRRFDRGDTPDGAPVAVVNEKFVSEYLSGVDPIGERVRVFGAAEGPWATIVGVVATEKRPELMHEMTWHEQAVVYRPLAQEPSASLSIALRTRARLADAGRSLERALAEIDEEVPSGEVSAMPALLGGYLKYPRFRAIVLDQFAGFAVLLAALGLNGLLSQYVSRRRRELGLRMAVGARTRDIVRLVVLQGGMPVLAGLAAGTLLTLCLAGYLANLLFGVTPGDPWTMLAAPAALLAAALAAVARPAWDAAALDPAVALRDE